MGDHDPQGAPGRKRRPGDEAGHAVPGKRVALASSAHRPERRRGGDPLTVAAILLAGGESTRMGVPKPLLEWGGYTLIEYQLAQLKGPPLDRVVVVLGHRADDVLPYVRSAGAQAIVNELYAEGRASSLRVGAAALPDDTTAVLILNLDQPRPHDVIARLVDVHRHSGSLITIPTYEEKRGHPPVLDGSLLPELREVNEATQGLRAVIARHEADVTELAFETASVLLDLNQPQEYQRARASYFAPQTRTAATGRSSE
ncbi:MAG: nucleotidyltransferase family protein [Dehalococcoidia bacterium]|nr:nucleotidyltransferase family protein [Dehalococcoidia bacterium]